MEAAQKALEGRRSKEPSLAGSFTERYEGAAKCGRCRKCEGCRQQYRQRSEQAWHRSASPQANSTLNNYRCPAARHCHQHNPRSQSAEPRRSNTGALRTDSGSLSAPRERRPSGQPASSTDRLSGQGPLGERPSSMQRSPSSALADRSPSQQQPERASGSSSATRVGGGGAGTAVAESADAAPPLSASSRPTPSRATPAGGRRRLGDKLDAAATASSGPSASEDEGSEFRGLWGVRRACTALPLKAHPQSSSCGACRRLKHRHRDMPSVLITCLCMPNGHEGPCPTRPSPERLSCFAPAHTGGWTLSKEELERRQAVRQARRAAVVWRR